MKKTINILKRVFSILVIAVAVIVMIFTIVSVTTFDRNDRDIFGFKAFIVLSDSMKATDFAAGDVVVVKEVDPETLQPGDIITFSSQNTDSYGKNITHKIRALTKDANGEKGFITYGTTTGVDDETIVTYPYINGKYIFHLAGIGTFFYFLKSTPGYICCILIPFLLLIGMQALNTVKLFKRYKKEQLRALEKEREEIAAQRKESEEMMEEIRRLRSQLEGRTAPQAAGTARPDALARSQAAGEASDQKTKNPADDGPELDCLLGSDKTQENDGPKAEGPKDRGELKFW